MRKVLTALAVFAATSLIPLSHAQAIYKVGVAQRAFLRNDPSYPWRGAKIHALLTTVWYPASPAARETAQWIGDPSHRLASAGRAAVDAPLAPSPARFPLVLLSHGTGGSALQMAWLGTVLARHGFIAAAVNHPGNNALEPYTVQGFTLGWLRALDISRVLTALLADPQFAPRIDPRRIGAAGFSYGGYTVIELAGGIGNLSRIPAECSRPGPPLPICQSPPEFPDLIPRAIQLDRTNPAYRRALDASALPHRDPRIRAVFAIAPFGSVFSPSSLARISIPVSIVAGSGDPILSPSANAEFLARHIPGAHLTILPGGVGHYTFLDTCTPQAIKIHPLFCVDRPGVRRSAVHAHVALLAVDFFTRNLRRTRNMPHP